jgi:hypothetical protein
MWLPGFLLLQQLPARAPAEVDVPVTYVWVLQQDLLIESNRLKRCLEMHTLLFEKAAGHKERH